MHIPVKLSNGSKTVETTTLIDCGATGNFINAGILSSINFPLERLPKPIFAHNVDGTPNSKGTIQWKAHTHARFNHYQENLDLMVLSLGQRQIILGMSWLRKWNPCIDWNTQTLSLPLTPKDITYPDHSPQRYLLHWLGLDADRKIAKRL
ncbi:hypothetical protein OG21DRAFT_1427125 [Imleria badia]|nr:hypothetical protein OG21DRAFT_1427125 [Imleria badia]